MAVYDDAASSLVRSDCRNKPVQALVEHGIQALPEEYIQPYDVLLGGGGGGKDEDEASVTVPVVDMSGIASADESVRRSVLRVIDDACAEWGAFQVINHGIAADVLDGMKDAAKHFYQVPVEEKMRYFVTVFDGRPMRYSTSFDSSRDVILEWKDVLRVPAEAPAPSEGKNGAWPAQEHLPREPVTRYGKAINDFVSILLEAMSESLGLPAGYLNGALASRERILAMNFYPPCPNPERVLGLGAHSDATAITVLIQNDVVGLQLFHKNKWVTVKPQPNAILINLGDQLQILSNGKYHSVEHRAFVNKEKLRISIATLVGPSKASSIAPAPQLVDETHPALYKPVVFQDYLLHYMRNGLNTRAALRHIATAESKAADPQQQQMP